LRIIILVIVGGTILIEVIIIIRGTIGIMAGVRTIRGMRIIRGEMGEEVIEDVVGKVGEAKVLMISIRTRRGIIGSMTESKGRIFLVFYVFWARSARKSKNNPIFELYIFYKIIIPYIYRFKPQSRSVINFK